MSNSCFSMRILYTDVPFRLHTFFFVDGCSLACTFYILCISLNDMHIDFAALSEIFLIKSNSIGKGKE